jgi:twinkle protein
MTYKTACPECRASGRDRSGDNMTVFDEGNTYCHACGYKGRIEEETIITDSATAVGESETVVGEWFTLDSIEDLPIGSNPARGISKSVAQTYGTRIACDEYSGKPSHVFYPYYSGDDIVGWKMRDLDKAKKFSFGIIGKPTGLFGQNPQAKGFGNLLITEGEEDCLAAKEMLSSGLSTECDVVSLPNGATFDKKTMAEHEWIKGYKNVFVCMDNDEPGKAVAEKLGSWLCPSTHVRVVELDKTYGKDASDYLVRGFTPEFKKAIKASKQYQPLGILNGDELNLDDLLAPEEEGYPIPFRGLNKALHGLRKGEIVTVCADSGIGKTTFSRELAKSLIEQDCGVAMIALEDQLKVTAKSLIALDMNIPLSEFRFRPPTKSEAQPSFDKLIAKGSTYFYKHEGTIDNNKLLTTLASYARSRTVDFIILDHIGVALAGTESSRMGEAKAIDILMNKLAALVVETGVGIILVAHLKRQADGVVHEEGREIKLTDLRGSAALEQYAFAVVGLERDQQAEEEVDNNKVRVRLLKNRVFSRTGVVDRLIYDPSTGRLNNPPLTVLPPMAELHEE